MSLPVLARTPSETCSCVHHLPLLIPAPPPAAELRRVSKVAGFSDDVGAGRAGRAGVDFADGRGGRGVGVDGYAFCCVEAGHRTGFVSFLIFVIVSMLMPLTCAIGSRGPRFFLHDCCYNCGRVSARARY